MTFAASDLGDIERLARAIGLVDEGGGFNDDWLANPGDYLALGHFQRRRSAKRFSASSTTFSAGAPPKPMQVGGSGCLSSRAAIRRSPSSRSSTKARTTTCGLVSASS